MSHKYSSNWKGFLIDLELSLRWGREPFWLYHYSLLSQLSLWSLRPCWSQSIPRMIGESSPSASSPHRAGPLAGTPCRCTPGTPPSLARPSPRYESHRSDQTALGFGCSASVVAGSASGSVSGCSAGPPQPGCTPGPAGAPGGAPG